MSLPSGDTALGRLQRTLANHESGASIGPCAVRFDDLAKVLALIVSVDEIDNHTKVTSTKEIRQALLDLKARS